MRLLNRSYGPGVGPYSRLLCWRASLRYSRCLAIGVGLYLERASLRRLDLALGTRPANPACLVRLVYSRLRREIVLCTTEAAGLSCCTQGCRLFALNRRACLVLRTKRTSRYCSPVTPFDQPHSLRRTIIILPLPISCVTDILVGNWLDHFEV